MLRTLPGCREVWDASSVATVCMKRWSGQAASCEGNPQTHPLLLARIPPGRTIVQSVAPIAMIGNCRILSWDSWEADGSGVSFLRSLSRRPMGVLKSNVESRLRAFLSVLPLHPALHPESAFQLIKRIIIVWMYYRVKISCRFQLGGCSVVL